MFRGGALFVDLIQTLSEIISLRELNRLEV